MAARRPRRAHGAASPRAPPLHTVLRRRRPASSFSAATGREPSASAPPLGWWRDPKGRRRQRDPTSPRTHPRPPAGGRIRSSSPLQTAAATVRIAATRTFVFTAKPSFSASAAPPPCVSSAGTVFPANALAAAAARQLRRLAAARVGVLPVRPFPASPSHTRLPSPVALGYGLATTGSPSGRPSVADSASPTLPPQKASPDSHYGHRRQRAAPNRLSSCHRTPSPCDSIRRFSEGASK